MRAGLIGTPLRRAHSAVMHNAAFAHHGIAAHYDLRELGAADLGGFVSEVRAGEWLGFNVTAPHKQAIVPFLDRVEEGAAAIGAVNAVTVDDGALVGFNTDASGFLVALRAAGGPVQGARAVVFGAGGAARAVVWALLTAGADSVTVVNRTAERAEALARDLSDHGAVAALDAAAATVDGVLSSADLAVNTTTVGMTVDDVPFDVTALDRSAFVFDVVYVPPETPLLAAARSRGLAVSNGLEMLVRQAEVAFERWTGVPDTADVMRSALEAWLPEAQSER